MTQIEPHPSHTRVAPGVRLSTGVECRTPFPFLDGYGSPPSEAQLDEQQRSSSRGTAQLIEKARHRANDEALSAITSARAVLATTPEYTVQSDASGKRLLVPTRAIALGMAEYLEESYRRTHPADQS